METISVKYLQNDFGLAATIALCGLYQDSSGVFDSFCSHWRPPSSGVYRYLWSDYISVSNIRVKHQILADISCQLKVSQL